MSDQKRFQVFISSTYTDLLEERQAVVTALLQLDAFPSGMELFPAANDDAWTLIKRIIDECDYYLLVIGGRYGSVDPTEDLSYTEKEYDYALSAGKPIMAFLHGDEGSIPMSKGENSDEGRAKLAAFRDKVKQTKHVRYWTSALGLRAEVIATYSTFSRNYPAVGWVKADQQASIEALTENNAMRKQIAELEAQLHRVRTSAPPGTDELAQGTDTLSFRICASASYRPRDRGPKTYRVWSSVEETWDSIFQEVGPYMLDECEQENLKERLEENLKNEHYIGTSFPQIKKFVQESLNLDEEPPTNFFYEPECEVQDRDFGTIIIQLTALGLIERSDRKRSVSDKSTYWTLTPYGNNRLVQLRAIRKPEKGE